MKIEQNCYYETRTYDGKWQPVKMIKREGDAFLFNSLNDGKVVKLKKGEVRNILLSDSHLVNLGSKYYNKDFSYFNLNGVILLPYFFFIMSKNQKYILKHGREDFLITSTIFGSGDIRCLKERYGYLALSNKKLSEFKIAFKHPQNQISETGDEALCLLEDITSKYDLITNFNQLIKETKKTKYFEKLDFDSVLRMK